MAPMTYTTKQPRSSLPLRLPRRVGKVSRRKGRLVMRAHGIQPEMRPRHYGMEHALFGEDSCRDFPDFRHFVEVERVAIGFGALTV